MLFGGINYRCMTTALPSLLTGVAGRTAVSSAAPASIHPTSGGNDRKRDTGVSQPRGAHNAALVLLVLAAGCVGQFFGGHAADKLKPSVMYPVFIALTIPLALLMAHGSQSTTVFAAMALCAFVFAQQPIENTLLAQATPAQWRSTMYGLKFILTFGIGAFGAQLTGIIWQRIGLYPVFDIFAVGALVMVCFAVMYWAFCNRRDKMPAPRNA
jgi:predicted MFS family arabinose efflux permease